MHGKDADAAKQELIDRLRKPSGFSREDRIRLAASVIQRAMNRGATEVEVYRFPHELCTDNGRAINQGEPGGKTRSREFRRKCSSSGANICSRVATRSAIRLSTIPAG